MERRKVAYCRFNGREKFCPRYFSRTITSEGEREVPGKEKGNANFWGGVLRRRQTPVYRVLGCLKSWGPDL